MPKPTPWEDESTPLCESCGYVVAGLPQDTNCPECGRPIAQSLPERRPGTTFQNHPSPRTMLTTGVGTILHPRRTLDKIRFDTNPEEDSTLALWHAMATGLVLMPVPLVATLHFTDRLLSAATAAVILFIIAGIGFLFLLAYLIAIGIRMLTVTESLGLRVISRQRGFRITPRIAVLITSHGSVGWTGGAVLAWATGFAAYAVTFDPKSGPYWLAVILAASCAQLGGFLFFETFAYLGLRRLKYANTISASDHPKTPNLLTQDRTITGEPE